MRGGVWAAIAAIVVILAGGPALAQDRIFATSFGDGRLVEVDFGAGTITNLLGGLSSPEDIVCKEATEELFVCESLYDRVFSLDLVSMTTQNIIPTAGAVAGPEGPSISPDGDLYVNTRERFGTANGVWMVPGGDPANGVVQSVPFFTTFGEGTAFGRAGSTDGGLLAVDRDNGRVILSNPPGSAPTLLITGLSRPFGIAVNSLGEIFVVESPLVGGGWISRWTSDGAPLGDFFTGLGSPAFIEVDSADNIVVADFGGLLMIDPAGVVIGQVAFLGATGVAICRSAPLLPCPMSQGFWKNHRRAWPVSTLVMGNETYTKGEALTLLRTPVRGDASLILAKQLIAAKLNLEEGSDPTPIAAEIAAADILLGGFIGKMPYDVHPSTSEGHDMTAIAGVLDDYNNRLFAGDCEETHAQVSKVLAVPQARGGCIGSIGAPMTPGDAAGAMLPWALLAIWLAALHLRRSRRPVPEPCRR